MSFVAAKKKKHELSPEGHRVEHLPSGERVRIHPDTGRKHLMPTRSRAHEQIVAASADLEAAQAELRQAHIDRVEQKKAAQTAKGLPPEKSLF